MDARNSDTTYSVNTQDLESADAAYPDGLALRLTLAPLRSVPSFLLQTDHTHP